jgi:integrase
MGRRGSRTFIAPNISQDDSGLSVKVTVAGKTVERRFPHGTPLPDLEDVRDRLKGQQGAARPARPGTLSREIRAYLRTISDPRKLKDQAALCAHWVPVYGDAHRFTLTPLVIRQQMALWRKQGAAASSCNHRLSALRAVFRAVNEPDDPNYPAQVKKLAGPALEPRALDYATIARILDAMPDRGRPTGHGRGTRPTVSLTKLRCRLFAYTGIPWAQMAQIDPVTDIDWTTPALRARPRRKGKGTRETWLPLMPQAVAALRALVDAGALPGHFSTGSMYKSFQTAVAKLRKDDPTLPHIRPYDLRHSFATEALAASSDLAGVQHLLQHSTPQMTTRYTLAAVPAAAARAAAMLGDRLGAPPAKKD